jgi:cytochrome c2
VGYGCGSCHEIPGVPGAAAKVGPPLEGLLQRASLSGDLPNTPENLVRWIEHPQSHRPGTLMPEMNVTKSDARDVAPIFTHGSSVTSAYSSDDAPSLHWTDGSRMRRQDHLRNMRLL